MDGDMDGEGGGADSSQRPSSININSNPEPGAESGLRRYIGPCKSLHHAESKKTATMLRLFRYESWSPKIVAEPHADLGLLSLVIGDVPGLEVWNGHQFWDIEREYHRWGPEKPCATLLGGRQLERLSNFRYAAGGHRVVSYGKPAPIPPPALSKSTKKGHSHDNTDTTVLDGEGGDKAYRYSIVFVLRAHEDVIVDTDALTTSITGVFKEPVRGLRAGTWYEQIRGKHFNINIGFEEREKQRRKVAGRKAGVGIGMQGQEKGKEEGRDGGMGAG
ncbi:hypothetical protein K491DRAFT_699279 [Lophiostoma macrostomum CBS 122681]|uniref:Isopenicillin N synthase-like Fe(2+) 2OG dioxygenase domain-containing protein n=1 Tax=Lophiostoma macrostomum CBS 122681 TaxID=1314788 RepID=A0A6A6SJP0_9PLEO|nr:hypothetical protein K491DRAFT_699279 [Lophiostoma macrostomum CBS 122681]